MVVWGAIGSRSAVIFDIEGDGDLDIVTNDFNTRPMVLLSNLSERNAQLHYLKIQLQGVRSNRDGLGAKVQVTTGQGVLTQVHDGQSGYLSQSSMPLYFGLGEAAVVEVTGLRNPCYQLDRFRPGLMAAVLGRDAQGELIRKAGVMGVVLAGGEIKAGDPIRVELPSGQHRSLKPV
jgi:hypothetical protein